MSLSAYLLLSVKFGTCDEARTVLRVCLDVFQNNFGFAIALDSRLSILSKFSLFHFLISFTTLFRSVLYFFQKKHITGFMKSLNKTETPIFLSVVCSLFPKTIVLTFILIFLRSVFFF